MAYVNFVSSLYLPILKCLFWACNASKLRGFISRLQILVAECSLQTSSWKQPSLEARSPSPYKGPRFRPTQREHHQICSTWKGERGDKVIVFKCESHSSPLLHQIVGSGNPQELRNNNQDSAELSYIYFHKFLRERDHETGREPSVICRWAQPQILMQTEDWMLSPLS